MKELFIVLGVIGFITLFFCSVVFRLILFHPFKTIGYACKDIYQFFKYHKYDIYDGGLLNCYFAHFGGGKTLSIVEYACWLFKRYNNKRVYDVKRRQWVLQKVHIISNVRLTTVPFEELVSLSQVVCCAWRNKKIDKENGTRTIVFVLLDEASSQMNSRNFKSNIDPDFLNTLITSRHFLMSLFYTSQKFKLVDALLRNVTQTAVSCKKVWRFMVQEFYDADELELATHQSLLQPIRRTGFFVTDKHYSAYDTLATVDKLKKAVDAGEMMSEQEILAMRGTLNPDNDSIVNPSRKLRRVWKKRR